MIRFDCALNRPDFAFEAAFTAEAGITALFGPSGSGKSTAIRLLAGLERPSRGSIAIGEQVLVDTQRRIFVPPHRRRVGLVFQDAQLLPHLSVRSNLTYGRWFTPRAERRIGFEPVVDVLGIGHLLARRPETLSGGERQRVAIGRALIASPRLLLMDEPLASLDAARKLEILPFIERLRDEFAIPIVYVSHQIEEVARLAARVVRLDRGRVAAIGTFAEALGRSRPPAAEDRFDVASILTTRVREARPEYGLSILSHPAGEIVVLGAARPGAEVLVAVKATNVTLTLDPPSRTSARTVLEGRVAGIETDQGPLALVTLALAGGEKLVALSTRMALDALALRPGVRAWALVKAVVMEAGGEADMRGGR